MESIPAKYSPVLVVDDDPIIRELHAEMLKESGYAVECAEDGDEALRMLRTGAFRLVVSEKIAGDHFS